MFILVGMLHLCGIELYSIFCDRIYIFLYSMFEAFQSHSSSSLLVVDYLYVRIFEEMQKQLLIFSSFFAFSYSSVVEFIFNSFTLKVLDFIGQALWLELGTKLLGCQHLPVQSGVGTKLLGCKDENFNLGQHYGWNSINHKAAKVFF